MHAPQFCRHCGKEITAAAAPPEFCSPQCRTNAHSARWYQKNKEHKKARSRERYRATRAAGTAKARLSVTLGDAEFARVSAEALVAGMNLHDWIRHRLLSDPPT